MERAFMFLGYLVMLVLTLTQSNPYLIFWSFVGFVLLMGIVIIL